MRLMVAMLIMINGEVARSERLGVSFAVSWSIAERVGEESEVDALRSGKDTEGRGKTDFKYW